MAVGIANNTIKHQCLRSMEMQCFWICDKVSQDAYNIRWHPGQENLVDYQSKLHNGAHHQAVCPWYLHEENSPLVLPRATRPSTLKGCVGTLPAGYVHNVTLPHGYSWFDGLLRNPRSGVQTPQVLGYSPMRVALILGRGFKPLQGVGVPHVQSGYTLM